MLSVHGGDIQLAAERLGVGKSQILDASASLAPWAPALSWSDLRGGLRDYPDRQHAALRFLLARVHHIDAEHVLPGNGAAELFTWAGRDAAALGRSLVATPGFVDYRRALSCWDASSADVPLPLDWLGAAASPHPFGSLSSGHDVLWICNPHNPTGQLWSRASLQPLLDCSRLVICDEAFLSLVPDGEQQSLIPLVEKYSNLVVIRSLTKLYGIAGLRLGYAVAQPQRLQRWAAWRDPWPVNGLALAAAAKLLRSPEAYQRWCTRVHRWVASEGIWMQQKLAELPGITPMPSAANFLLIRSDHSLVSLREAVETRHRILLRDCRSFEGLGECWLRIGLQTRANNRRIIHALRQELDHQPLV